MYYYLFIIKLYHLFFFLLLKCKIDKTNINKTFTRAIFFHRIYKLCEQIWYMIYSSSLQSPEIFALEMSIT